MAVVNAWTGAPTPDGARVVAKVDSGTSVELIVSTSPALLSPTNFGPETPDAEGIVSFTATGLDTDTQYYWALEIDSVQDETFPGKFHTLPTVGEAASFSFAVSGDAGLSPDTPGEGDVLAANRLSNHVVFDQINARNPRFFVHLGDPTYYDLGSGNHGIIGGASVDNYRRMYDDLLLQPRQHRLYRERPLVLLRDDHGGGPPDWDGTFVDKANSSQVYRERVPHYPLEDEAGLWHSFQVGRVLFVATDARYYRSPVDDPDGPDKTMLGAAQMAWLDNLLSTSDAEGLVFLDSIRWNQDDGVGVSWGAYAHERGLIVDMLTRHGWLDRMVMFNADTHSMGLDTGTRNSWGGFPTMLVAPLDATPSPSNLSKYYDLGFSSQRGQYGIVQVTDDGETLTITCTGYTGDAVFESFTVTIGPDPDPVPEPEPSAPPIAVGTIRETVHWQGVDDRTGRVIADLPDLTGETSRLLMAYTSGRLDMTMTESGPGGLPIEVVEQATQPQGCSIVQIVNDLPVWAGRVLLRSGGSAGPLSLGVVSSEQYLLQRRVTARAYTGQDRALVAADLLTDAGSTDLGPGMGLEIDFEPCGDTVDREYLPSDLVTVYKALRELAEAGTFEWTIDYDWADSTATVLRRIMRLRRRIGRSGGQPPIFETEAGVTYTLTEDFSSGRYANHVTVYGDGEGEDLPRSEAQVDAAALAGGVPIVEHAMHVRDVSDPAELNAIATAELARLMHGVELWDLECVLHEEPRLGLNAGIGDTGRWRFTSVRHPSPDGVRPGVEGSGRIIGWGLDAEAERWRPQLLDPHEATAL